jgi:hypothetical protein
VNVSAEARARPPLSRDRRVLAAALAVVLLLGFGVAALIAHGRVDNGSSPTPGLGAQVSGGAVAAIGPLTGTEVRAYVADRQAALQQAKGVRVAVVSLARYMTEAQAKTAVGSGATVALVAAAPGGTPSVVRGSIGDWVDQQKDSAKADRDETQQLLKNGVDDPEFETFYKSEVARLTRLIDGIKPDAPLVFAVVVRAPATTLQRLTGSPDIRLVDVGSSGQVSGRAQFRGLRPEETAQVNQDAPRPF